MFEWPWNRRRRLLADLSAAWGRPSSQKRPMDAIAAYHRTRVAADGIESVDDRTWNDLDLDAVFAIIDRSASTIGQQALYHRLRSIPAAGARAEDFEALVTHFSTTPLSREAAQRALMRLRDPSGYDLWSFVQPGAVDTRPWHVVFPAIALVMLAALAAMPFQPAALIVVVAGLVGNLAIRAITQTRIGVVLGSFRQIGPLLSAAQIVATLDLPPGEAPDALRRAVPPLQRLHRIARWVSRDPLANGELITSALEYLNLLFLLDANALYFAARELRRNGAALLEVLAALGDVDTALSVASYRAGENGWTRPRFVEPSEPSRCTALRHPLLPDAVPNSIELLSSHGMLVTGSNMSGKSTFLRTVGVAAIMAQSINTVLASEYRAPRHRVRSTIGVADDLVSGKSYYLAEVEAVMAVVRASREAPPHLFLLDELFRGTNAVERIAAAEAVLVELLAGGSPHIVIAATHDLELVDLLHERYAPFYFEDSLAPTGLTFIYRLTAGPATTRNAIALLELNGAPRSLIERALARAAELDRQRHIAGVNPDQFTSG